MIGEVNIWEFIWTGRLPHLSRLPHLPGVAHLHENRTLEDPVISGCFNGWLLKAFRSFPEFSRKWLCPTQESLTIRDLGENMIIHFNNLFCYRFTLISFYIFPKNKSLTLVIVQLLCQVWEGGQKAWVKVSEGYQSASMGHMPIKRSEIWQV